MKLLCLETATQHCSVCISDGLSILSFEAATEDYAHTTQITILIETNLANAGLTVKDLDAIVLSKGPGSYTALRVGAAVAKGICFAINKPLIAVDTLQAIAQATYTQVQDKAAIYCPMIDARRMEVYTACYDANGNKLTAITPLIVTEHIFHDYFDTKQRLIFSGNGAEKCKAVIQSPFAQFEQLECSALHLPKVAIRQFEQQKFEDLAYFKPDYGKAPNITTPKKKL